MRPAAATVSQSELRLRRVASAGAHPRLPACMERRSPLRDGRLSTPSAGRRDRASPQRPSRGETFGFPQVYAAVHQGSANSRFSAVGFIWISGGKGGRTGRKIVTYALAALPRPSFLTMGHDPFSAALSIRSFSTTGIIESCKVFADNSNCGSSNNAGEIIPLTQTS